MYLHHQFLYASVLYKSILCLLLSMFWGFTLSFIASFVIYLEEKIEKYEPITTTSTTTTSTRKGISTTTPNKKAKQLHSIY